MNVQWMTRVTVWIDKKGLLYCVNSSRIICEFTQPVEEDLAFENFVSVIVHR